MLEDARMAALQADEKLKAKPVEPGKYDLVIDPTQLFLTIHESVGHPTELDRVLGTKPIMPAPVSVTLDKWKSKNFNFGNKLVNFVGDKTQRGSLGAVGYDDEGVRDQELGYHQRRHPCKLPGNPRPGAYLGLNESHGSSYAQSWQDVQFQRMPNVSLQPGKAAMSAMDMIKNVEKGIYILGRNSYSIDQQRYNFQFSGQAVL
jgi:TldD protein